MDLPDLVLAALLAYIALTAGVGHFALGRPERRDLALLVAALLSFSMALAASLVQLLSLRLAQLMSLVIALTLLCFWLQLRGDKSKKSQH